MSILFRMEMSSYFYLPDHANAASLRIEYPDKNNRAQASESFDAEHLIQLVHDDVEKGVVVIERAFLKDAPDKKVSFTLNSMDRKNTYAKVGYAVYDDSSRVMVSGEKTLDVVAVPNEFALHPNYPNPFNPSTNIDFDIVKDGHTQVVVYDIMGRKIKNLIGENMKAGYHTVAWNGKNDSGNNVSAGVYLCTLSTSSFTKTIKLLLLK